MRLFRAFALVLVVMTLGIGCDERMNMVDEVVDMAEEPKPPEDQLMSLDPFFIHGDGTSDTLASEWIQEKPRNERDFVGCVLVPKHHSRSTGARQYAHPLPDVTVTIVTGPRSGESVMTNQNGRYIFPNVEEDKLHLLVEKEPHFEPKEVIVHRSSPTALTNGIVPNYEGDPQREPGNILMGQRWPDEVRFILEQTLVMPDLLYIQASLGGDYAGFYGNGVVKVDAAGEAGSFITFDEVKSIWSTFAHEIAHAHQNALSSSPDGTWHGPGWAETPEGIAFVEARRKDLENREEGQEKPYFDIEPGSSTHIENAAEICSYYWSAAWWGDYELLETSAPHRLAWVKEWFGE